METEYRIVYTTWHRQHLGEKIEIRLTTLPMHDLIEAKALLALYRKSAKDVVLQRRIITITEWEIVNE